MHRNHELDELCSCVRCSAAGCDVTLMNQQCLLNKVHTNRNTHRTKSYANQLTKEWQEADVGGKVQHLLVHAHNDLTGQTDYK